ncbi:putative siderophore transport system ATP-binding protein YusV [Planctomycetes bacterium Pan216]|uniref:Putative siderophore transport system ATP-binding protein YusV n=1 Tax=Kolteria novifilia TaxID=2527975 RepID=A0A518AZW9_9BACT|nr:putative siderophore transport system ATP-binding protein YusV [Planctomycetes bacterium Pan216]
MNRFASEHLTVRYERKTVIEQLSVSLPVEKISAIVGANGSGKSTALKAFSRILSPYDGRVVLNSHSIHEMPSKELARKLSILPQAAQAPDSLTVGELVSYGRYPHRRWFSSLGSDDHDKIDWALEIVDLSDLRDRPVASLSGGQQQRVWIAMTLAQGAEILLLDEPTSHLDTCHQLEVMELLARLNRDEGKTVVMVLHDLNLAARYAHHMIALKDGDIADEGTPEEVMNSETLRTVFGIEAHITRDPRIGTPICIPYMDKASEACQLDSLSEIPHA